MDTSEHPVRPKQQIVVNSPTGENLVISGISGVFPDTHDVGELAHNLYNKVNMLSKDERPGFQDPSLPPYDGTVPYDLLVGFDAGYFGMHCRTAAISDSTTKVYMERIIEAVMDAGLHPSDLENTKTAIFTSVSIMISEGLTKSRCIKDSYQITSCAKSMLAGRAAYLLKTKGPALNCDTACSSSLVAIDVAMQLIRLGECDAAIVSGVNTFTDSHSTLQFFRMGVLSPEGMCQSFDKDGRGYARAEASCTVFIQKEKDAKRIYAQLIHGKTNCDGYKEMGITYPSGDDQYQLLSDFYEEVNIQPSQISYVEAHGTGTTVGDPEECRSIDRIFTKGRDTPLLVGSVKSNLGHAEPASGLISLFKGILAFENDLIPPNLHFREPKPDIPSIIQGRLKVVTESTKFEDDRYLIGTNSFGFGGVNAHVLMKRIAKEKQLNNHDDNIPRLVCVSGRTEVAATVLLDSIIKGNSDLEYISLLHNVFRKEIPQHQHKGYSILRRGKEVARSISEVATFKQSFSIMFGELKNWHNIACEFASLPIFNELINRVSYIVDMSQSIRNIVFSNNEAVRRENNILGSAIVELCLADILKQIELKPVNTLGYGYGQLICAYFDNAITLEEAVRCIVVINRCLQPKIVQNEESKSAATTNGGIGPDEDILASLDADKLQLRQILRKQLEEVLNYPREWKSSSLKKRYASVQYFTDAVLKWVRECQSSYFKPKGLILELGFSDIHRSTTKANTKWLSFCTFVGFLETIGSLHQGGYACCIAKLYPEIKWPVSRGTPMISPNIKWNHDRIWPYDITDDRKICRSHYEIDVNDKLWSFVTGHVIDGRNLFPATGYLILTWQSLQIIKKFDFHNTDICFEHCRFIRATSLPPSGSVKLTISHMENGDFEISEGDTIVVTGTIKLITNERDVPKILKSSTDDVLSMNKKDIYKELRLRGYNYSGEFRALENCNVEGTRGEIFWNKSWIPFIDNMFQIQILSQDSRQLYVPTYLRRLTICPQKHYKSCKAYSTNAFNDALLPIYYNPEANTIRSGYVFVEGLQASSIARKKHLGIPVLEKYQFIPNITRLSDSASVRVNMQIILENTKAQKIVGVELIDKGQQATTTTILSPIVLDVLGDQPLIQAELRIYSDKQNISTDILVENKSLSEDDEYNLVIGTNLLKRQELSKAVRSLKDQVGYIISREDVDFKLDTYMNNNLEMNIITVHHTPNETFVLLGQKAASTIKRCIHVPSYDTTFEWLPEVQEAVAVNGNKEIILFSQQEPLGGLLGFVNCLRREPDSGNVRCVIVNDDVNGSSRPFDVNDAFYVKQLSKNMAINVYKDGAWGTYRHLLLEDTEDIENDHCYVNQTVRGDLSSLRWMEGSINLKEPAPFDRDRPLVKVHYAALNFRDVMTASGKINADVITSDRLEQECVQGFEFSGMTMCGDRVMGMVSHGAMSTLVMADQNLLIKIPDDWSLEEAATVPVVYGTIIYAIRERGHMKRGESILIHSGLGGVGQAAITYSLANGLEVFTTVGNQSRKEQLKKIFPTLKDSHIGNSHDITFEQMVMAETNGKGVDMVLNSLAEEKLLASVRCLARGGRFLEIGKFDISSNNQIGLHLLEKDCTFHGVMLDKLFNTQPEHKVHLCRLILDGIKNGSVKPLNRSVFKFDEIEKAFRFMTAGKHMGKVLIEVRSMDKNKEATKFTAMPRYYCTPTKSYIIIGGLGGLGLEITDWLIIRGARRIVLTSRSGVKNGYQKNRIRIWKKYGVTIKISRSDVTTKAGCEQLIKESQELGPIEAIFNLAAVLQDATFQNQTKEMFNISLAPKAYATKYLDELTRRLCPDLRDFVVFSSVSCGRGNAGQTNYGMANSIMERVCEQRRADGFPGLAVEWGAVGDVGLVADMQDTDTELEISGTLQQRISSCIEVMDVFLRQKSASIVSSMVVAEKKNSVLSATTPLVLVAGILGISDLNAISPLLTLAEMGMDSMTAVEIRQSLEREFDIILNAKEIRNLTVARLTEFSNGDENVTQSPEATTRTTDTMVTNMSPILLDTMLPAECELDTLVTELPTSAKDKSKQPMFFIPGLEGYPKLFTKLASTLPVPALSLNFNYKDPKPTILEDAESYIPLMEKYLHGKEKPFIMIAHSYGAVTAMEIVKILESKGYTGKLLLMDGAQMLICEITKHYFNMSDTDLEIKICLGPFLNRIPSMQLAAYEDMLRKCPNNEERLKVLKVLLDDSNAPYTMEYVKLLHNAILTRLRAIYNHKTSTTLLKSKVVLCRPMQSFSTSLPDDYDLSKECQQPLEIKRYDGDHTSILENYELIEYVHSQLE